MEPLHTQQTILLAKWRSLIANGNSEEAEHILIELLRCINAIAGAIGFTG